MPLARLVLEARRNTPVIRPYDPSKPIPNLIEIGVERSGGVEGGKVKWQGCPHLRNGPHGNYLCSQFVSRCAQEKCKEKYIQA